jgi:hypothetical protein
MSLIPGGRADKFGNRFERIWVVSLALEVIEGRLSTIKWEPLGAEGEGVECVVTQPDGLKKYHQCKIQNGNEGKWSVADLGANGVLVNAKRHLEADPRCKFFFVSSDPVPALRDMAMHAMSCDDNPSDFVSHCLNSQASKKDFTKLSQYWSLDLKNDKDVARALDLLSRMECERGYRGGEEARVYRMAERIIDAEGKAVIAFLGDHLEQQMGKTQAAHQLVSALHENGYSLCDIRSNPSIPSAINKLQVRFREALVPHLIGQKGFKRSESEALLTRALAPGQSRLIFVTGEPGCGKSGVLLQLMDLLDQQAIPHLPIRLDADNPEKSVRIYSKEILDLPHSPSQCLRVYAGEQRAVLLIDQLDAIRWTSRNSQKAWEICKEILDDALRSPETSVVVVGRTMDFEDDPKIKHWKQELANSEAVSIEGFMVGALPEEDVATFVGNNGMIYASLLPKEKEILRNCQNLRLWTELARHGTVQAFSNRAKLLQKVWEHYRNKAFSEDNLSNSDMYEYLNVIVSYMERHGRLDSPLGLISCHPTAVNTFKRLGIISTDGSRVRFSHQSHLDYLIIEAILHKLLQGKEELIKWLKSSEQSLGRRDQVRLLLQLIRDEDSELYLIFLQEIFAGQEIRFHIQHLVLATLGQVTEPMDGEVELVKVLWKQEAWRSHVLDQVLMGHRPWLDRLMDDGTLPALLASQVDSERNQAISLCRGSATAAPEWFEHMLSPYWTCEDNQWRQIIIHCLSFNPEKDTETVFGWRLELARQGLNVDEHSFEIHLVNELANHNQVRACAFLSAVLEGYIKYCGRMGSGNGARRIEIHNCDSNYLLKACQTECRNFWHQLIPVFRMIIALVDDLRVNPQYSACYESMVSAANLTRFLAELLKISGTERLNQEGKTFIDELEGLIQPPASSHFRHLIADVLSSAPISLADEAIGRFLQIESPLDIDTEVDLMLPRCKDHLGPQDPAINLFAGLAHRCSSEYFEVIESLVLRFHSAYEMKTVKLQLEAIREGIWRGDQPNYYGLPQYALLLALPDRRLSKRGVIALRTWRCKFGDLKSYRVPKHDDYDLLPLVSPIPVDRVRFISNAEWIKLVYNLMTDQKKRSHFEWKETGDGSYSEASPHRLSGSLREAAIFMPQRYIKLGLRFPPDSPSCFFAALLHAATATEPPENADLDWISASVNDIEDLLRHIHDKMNREIALDFTRLIRSRPDEGWSDVTLDQLRIYALCYPEPDSIPGDTAATACVDLHELEFTILNTVRCTAFSAAARLLWADAGHLNWAINLAEDSLNNPSPAVLAATLELAYAIGKHDLNLACSLLVRACAATRCPIVSTQYGQQLMSHVWSRDVHIEPILRQSLDCANEKDVEQAGFWSTIGCVLKGIYLDLAAQAASGPPSARVGVVRAIIALIKQSKVHREECLTRLLNYLNDNDSKVLDAAASMIGTNGFLYSDDAPTFAAQFASTAAFLRDPSQLLCRLEDYEGSLLLFSEAISIAVSQISGPLADASSHVGRQLRSGMYIAKLLLRLYDQAEQENQRHLRSQCLDHWDALLRADVGSYQHMLTQIDR